MVADEFSSPCSNMASAHFTAQYFFLTADIVEARADVPIDGIRFLLVFEEENLMDVVASVNIFTMKNLFTDYGM